MTICIATKYGLIMLHPPVKFHGIIPNGIKDMTQTQGFHTKGDKSKAESVRVTICYHKTWPCHAAATCEVSGNNSKWYKRYDTDTQISY